jgi:hypothetical protein
MIDPIQLKKVNDLIDNDIDYQKEYFGMGKCDLCTNPAVNEVDFECGPGANYSASIAMCDDHFKEMEGMDDYDFQSKYSDIIETHWGDRMIDQADMLRDEAKYK